MHALVRWAIHNTPAMNTLMASVLVIGVASLFMLKREVFPEFELEILLVTVPYPGAAPEEIEEGICQKIEEAVQGIDGIKKVTSVAAENVGNVILELEESVDAQKVLGEVRSEVDRIPSLPLLAEDAEVRQITMRDVAIQVGVVGRDSDDDPQAELALREMAEHVRNELMRIPEVSQATIVGAKDYQIDIEISEATLRRYGLTLREVAAIVRRQNLDLPGGTIRTRGEAVLLKGENKHVVGSEIRRIPLVTQPNGVVLTVGDLGEVRDEFADVTSVSRIDGRPAMVISVQRTVREDLLAMTSAVKAYVREKKLPADFQLVTWADHSKDVKDRMDLLARNGLQGLALVLLVLALFLEFRLAFWVALGIPVSIFGAAFVLLLTGNSLNMLTLFAFLMALGIVVDDAIIVGENIYTHRQRGSGPVQAAVDGTVEVLPSVVASVVTTIVAFLPLLFVSGVMGKFIAVLPLAMIAMLVISLVESTFILPCHLAHHGTDGVSRVRTWAHRLTPPLRATYGAAAIGVVMVFTQLIYPLRPAGRVFTGLRERTSHGLNRLIRGVYLPLLRAILHHPMVMLSISVTMLIVTVAFIRGGMVPFVIFPKLDSNTLVATITFPDGTPAHTTDQATRRLEETIRQLHEQHAEKGMPFLNLTRRSVGYVSVDEGPGISEQLSGAHVGSVAAELFDMSRRSVSSAALAAEWRKKVGEFSGAEQLTFGSTMQGPGGAPIELKLLAKPADFRVLQSAVDEVKETLHDYPGVFDVADDSHPGKWEYQLRIKPGAMAMGTSVADLAESVRAAYYGEEVMRLQRGRHEVKLMVRYPRDERRTLAAFDQLRIRTADGWERPLTELAEVKVERSLAEINRVDQMRSITIKADVDESEGNAREIVADLRQGFVPQLLERHPELSVRWEGQQQQTVESIRSLFVGLVIAMFAMFVLLTLQFRSYFQPLLILAVIPFGLIGAVLGHTLMGLPLTMFSLFGLVALTGVVVNDSIVLIDFINHRVRDGMPLIESLLDAGCRRFRPVLLTSVTTVAALLPILTETSLQAQLVIPMATSLAFGLMVATAMVLLLVPTLYLVYARLTGIGAAPDEELILPPTPAAAWPAEAELTA